jgi:hypothetical protein
MFVPLIRLQLSQQQLAASIACPSIYTSCSMTSLKCSTCTTSITAAKQCCTTRAAVAPAPPTASSCAAAAAAAAGARLLRCQGMAVDAMLALLSHILGAVMVSCWLVWDHWLPAISKLGSVLAGGAFCNKLLPPQMQATTAPSSNDDDRPVPPSVGPKACLSDTAAQVATSDLCAKRHKATGAQEGTASTKFGDDGACPPDQLHMLHVQAATGTTGSAVGTSAEDTERVSASTAVCMRWPRVSGVQTGSE